VPSESLHRTITGGELELLPATPPEELPPPETPPLLETSASKWEELLAWQEATIWPPKAKHASAEISAQPAVCLQGTKTLNKEELLNGELELGYKPGL
jgi:hypothetical protein